MIARRLNAALSLLAPVLFASLLASTVVPAQAADLSPQQVSSEARCPVCGMYPSRYPQWMAQIVFSDYSAISFDSPVELFRFLNAMGQYDKRHTPADVGAIYVSHYGSKGWLDAKKAFFVFGSKVLGPMNEANGPAFATRAEADAFARTQGGQVLTFAEVTPRVLGRDDEHQHEMHSHEMMHHHH